MSLISLHSIEKSYGAVQAVRGFSLSIDRGEAVALVGPDGAGKTSIMRMICGLLVPDRGRITIDGHDVAGDLRDLKAAVGYMPQSFSLYPDLSVEENLVFYAGLYGITGTRYRQKLDYLYGFSNLAPFADRRAGALSGGMKQKLALSCALIHDPTILILDEPTTGVDPLSRRQFWEILSEFKSQGVTILVSTAYMDEVSRVDRACFMFGGRQLAEGTPGQLRGSFRGRIFRLSIPPTASLVDRLDGLPGIEARRFGLELHLYAESHHSEETVGAMLFSAGIDSSGLSPTDPSLEDCFIQLMELDQRQEHPRV